MIVNRIYKSKSSVAVACFLPGWAKDLSAPCNYIKALIPVITEVFMVADVKLANICVSVLTVNM